MKSYIGTSINPMTTGQAVNTGAYLASIAASAAAPVSVAPEAEPVSAASEEKASEPGPAASAAAPEAEPVSVAPEAEPVSAASEEKAPEPGPVSAAAQEKQDLLTNLVEFVRVLAFSSLAKEFKTEQSSNKAAKNNTTSYNKKDQVKAIANTVIWSAVVYGVASYIMAPAGTMFVAMLGANVAIALPLALAVYAIAAIVVKYGLFNAKAKREDTFKFFNTTDNYYKALIVVVSLLTLSVGPILAFSGIAMFEIFAATIVMQALTVATSAIVAVTVWRTLDKALHNTEVKFVEATESALANKDSWSMIALKALGVIFFAAVGYSLAAILPMFAGLVLPTWSALASGFSSLSMTGAFVATIVMSYFINVATYYATEINSSNANKEKAPEEPAASEEKAPAAKSSNTGFSDEDILAGLIASETDPLTFALPMETQAARTRRFTEWVEKHPSL